MPPRIISSWLNVAQTQQIMRDLRDGGHEAYFVGGCVRDTLCKRVVHDIDIATTAQPKEIIKLTKKPGVHMVTTGIDHGTVKVIAQGIIHEVTTFRRDTKTFGRRAKVTFSDNMHDDALRRDFTINALYADHQGQIIDPLQGLNDLYAKRIRFIGDPNKRIREDYLRILRFFRFNAFYASASEPLDKMGLAACGKHASKLSLLSKERIGHEMRKLLAAPNPTTALTAAEQSGVLKEILKKSHVKNMNTLIQFENPENIQWITRLAYLTSVNPKNALRLSNAENKIYQAIILCLENNMKISHIAYSYGAHIAHACAAIKAADHRLELDKTLEEDINSGQMAVFPISAKDFPTLRGKSLGNKLKQLKNQWIDSDFTKTKEDLLS